MEHLEVSNLKKYKKPIFSFTKYSVVFEKVILLDICIVIKCPSEK